MKIFKMILKSRNAQLKRMLKAIERINNPSKILKEIGNRKVFTDKEKEAIQVIRQEQEILSRSLHEFSAYSNSLLAMGD